MVTLAKDLAARGLPGPAVLATWTEHMRGTFEEPERLEAG